MNVMIRISTTVSKAASILLGVSSARAWMDSLCSMAPAVDVS